MHANVMPTRMYASLYKQLSIYNIMQASSLSPRLIALLSPLPSDSLL